MLLVGNLYVFLSVCDIPHYAVTSVEGFVKLTSHGSLFVPPWGWGCSVGYLRIWDGQGLGRWGFEQRGSSTLHFFERGFEKKREHFRGIGMSFNKRTF